MPSKIKKIFLNESVILSVIIINTIIIFITESGIINAVLSYIDIICTLFFVVEAIVKINTYSFRSYWKDVWNRLDFFLIIISIPSIITLFVDHYLGNLSVILALRLLRIFRVFRVFHFFPNINQIANGLVRALQQSKAILLGFIIIILISALINCCLFKNIAPEYFSTPWKSIYTVFQIFTIEGWYEIPDAIAAVTSPFIAKIVRLYFCLLLCCGGIIGMSFINSVFVDAMIEDNNDDMKEQLNRIEEKLEKLQKELNEKEAKQ